jgi:hypothetical protein
MIKPYIENSLPIWVRNIIASHLRVCPKCMEKYSKILRLLRIQEINRQKELLREEISSYIDFELPCSRVLSLNAKIYKDSEAKREYEIFNTLSDVMKSTMKRAKEEFIFDISKDVMEKLKNEKEATSSFPEKLHFPLNT